MEREKKGVVGKHKRQVNGAQKVTMQNAPRPRNGMHRGKKSAKDEEVEVEPDKTCKQSNM